MARVGNEPSEDSSRTSPFLPRVEATRGSATGRAPTLAQVDPAGHVAVRSQAERFTEAEVVKVARKSTGGRGSAEAIEKRRVARQLNTLFGGGGNQAGKLDGRTEKRRQRLLKELKDGKSGQALKPIELVAHANELLEMGETLASIRKNGVKTPKLDLGDSAEKIETVLRAQDAYRFRPEVWKLLGVDLAELPTDGAGAKGAARRRRKT